MDAVGAGGGAGYPARAHIGGNAAEITGTLTLPAGTAYLYVVVGAAGTGDNHGTSTGGGGSAVFAEDSGHALLAKLAIAGGGGGGAYNGDGGNAGSAGNSDNAQTVSGPGQPGVGPTGGAGGSGNYAAGAAGGTNNPTALTVASGGAGGAVPGGAQGGGGAGGYGGGGGGGGSRGSILSSNVAGGGGGSSLASAYLGSASISIATSTGGVQLPGLVAGDGSTGSVTLTFDGLATPGSPTAVTAVPGDGQVSVSFTAPSDNGSPITSYTVTASPGGAVKTCPGSPCVITGLADGTAYTFTVHATNANGDSSESSASNAVTPAQVPGAPTGVSAIAGNAQASVSFTAPGDDGGAAVTSYTVTASPGGATAVCPGSPCTVTGLTNGTTYTFTVHATNDIGNSPQSAASAPVTPVSVPGVPTGVTADPGDGQASISFTAPADDGGLPITSYTVTAAPGGATATCAASPCVLTGLTDGSSYTFTVHATNSHGNSAESGASVAVTPAAIPQAPTGVSATAGDSQASISFTAPASDGGAAITSYTVTASPGGATATCPGSPCVVTGLDNGTSYTFTVHATNDIGDSPESAASAAVTPVGPPAEPTGVTYTAGDSQIGVSFPVPANGGSALTGFQFSVDGGQTWQTLSATTAGGTVTATITGLDNGITYSVEVRGVNVNGPGDASAPQDVTPATVPGAPTAVSAQRGNASAQVSFTAPADDGGSPITSYTVTSTPGGLTATCPGSPCTISGLANGTTYTFTAHATNAAGSSAESTGSDPITPATVPVAPGSVTVTRGDAEASVTFTAPASGGSPITGYEYSVDGGLTWHTLPTSGSAPISGTIAGLTNGTAYSVSIRAVNDAGAGAASPSQSVTPATAPDAPTGVTATASAGQASVAFTAPSADGGSPVTSYTVTASPGGASATCPASPCVVTGLVNGTAYTFTVHDTNAAGDSPESAASTPVTPVSAPGAPGSVTATASDTTVTLSFTASDSGGSAITGYEYSIDGGTTWLPLSTNGSGADLTGSISGLTPGTDYSVIVRGVNGVGVGTASQPLAVSTLPATVARPTAVAGAASATVSWTESATTSVTGYTVLANPGPASCTTASRTATSCVIGATAGRSYTYTVIAHTSSASSPASAATDAIVAGAPPVPADAPTNAPATLTTTAGQLSTIALGQKITVTGRSFLPYSSVTIICYSAPQVLGTTVTDESGNLRADVTVPTNLTAGPHNLVASGVTLDGSLRFIQMPFTVTATNIPPSSSAPTATGSLASGSLASTGTPAQQLALWAIVSITVGAALSHRNRRRT